MRPGSEGMVEKEEEEELMVLCGGGQYWWTPWAWGYYWFLVKFTVETGYWPTDGLTEGSMDGPMVGHTLVEWRGKLYSGRQNRDDELLWPHVWPTSNRLFGQFVSFVSLSYGRFLDASTHLYKRVCAWLRGSVSLSVLRFFKWADYGRKWSELIRKTVFLLQTRQNVFWMVPKRPKMFNSDTILSKRTCCLSTLNFIDP